MQDSLVAASIGWIEVTDTLINIQTGLRIKNTTEDESTPTCEVFFPDGTTEEYSGPDAEAFFDRAEALAKVASFTIDQFNQFINQPAVPNVEGL